jgi:hypothetical protein
MSTEYLRRNLLVCKAVGAKAAAESARTRLTRMRRPPKWLLGHLNAIIERTAVLPPDLATYRNQAVDK